MGVGWVGRACGFDGRAAVGGGGFAVSVDVVVVVVAGFGKLVNEYKNIS